jgi:hypothetical protein
VPILDPNNFNVFNNMSFAQYDNHHNYSQMYKICWNAIYKMTQSNKGMSIDGGNMQHKNNKQRTSRGDT